MYRSLGIYIHIPFCASKCGYCDFYSLAGCDRLMPKYQDALVAHIRESYGALKSYEVDTVYFGGGTPSYYGAQRLAELWSELKNSGRVRRDAEVTLEANPDSARLKDLKLLHKEGFNRISLGAQSSNNDILKLIGRRHNWLQVEQAVQAAREAGFDNLSIDLIYGLPSQTRADWADTLMKTIDLRPEHISCYGLTLEKGTPMYKYQGSPFLPSDDEQADMYLYAVDLLAHYGYAQYEVSNFAIKGYESRHNLGYWTLKDYLGFGAGAHSCIGGARFSYVRDADAYIVGVLGDQKIVDEYESVTSLERSSEYLMLGMRTVRGVSAEEYTRICLADFKPIGDTLRLFARKGWAVQEEEGNWHFTPSGFLLSNLLIGALLESQSSGRVAVTPWMKAAFDAEEKTELPPGEEELFREMYEKRRGRK